MLFVCSKTKHFFFLVLFTFNVLYSYCDRELNQLWYSISDINNPKIEDYQLIEDYLQNGTRPYLEGFEASIPNMGVAQNGCRRRLNFMRNLKLIGANGEMPLFETYSFNINNKTDGRCIILFSTYNGIYQEKARKVLADLETSGYSGHVLLRIGGFPNTAHGGLKICHVPYAFKVAFFREAQLLGYKEVLWIDTAIHPLTNLEKVFKEIAWKGYFFTYVGTLNDNRYYHLPGAVQFLDITPDLLDRIPHMASGIIGLNFANSKAALLLDHWYQSTEKVYPNINWFPEELSLSVAAWRLNLEPSNSFGHICCGEHELSSIQNRPTLQFYLDALR